MGNPISDGDGHPFMSSERTVEAIAHERGQIIRVYGVMLAINFGMYAMTYVLSPGYIIPLLNHPIARIVICLLTFWELVAMGIHWYFAPISDVNRSVLYTLMTLFFYIPGLLYPMLGPATIAILSAIGPIMYSK